VFRCFELSKILCAPPNKFFLHRDGFYETFLTFIYHQFLPILLLGQFVTSVYPPSPIKKFISFWLGCTFFFITSIPNRPNKISKRPSFQKIRVCDKMGLRLNYPLIFLFFQFSNSTSTHILSKSFLWSVSVCKYGESTATTSKHSFVSWQLWILWVFSNRGFVFKVLQRHDPKETGDWNDDYNK